MDWIEDKSLWVFCPGFADELVGSEAFEGFEPTSKIVGGYEVPQMGVELSVRVVVITPDGCFFDGAVHAFDLAVCPRVFDLCQPMLDAVLPATHIEHVRHVSGGRTIGVARRERELNAVVG